MAVYALRALINGINQPISDSDSGRLATLSIGASGSTTDLTKTILDNLVALQNGTDLSDGTNAHTHDGRYFTETELGSATASSGSDLIGDDDTYSNFTPAAATIKGALSGIDTAIGTLTSLQPEWQDSVIDRYDPTSGLPAASTGDRYLATATANGWTVDKIYEYNGATWDETTPTTGTYVSVDDETDGVYYWGGASWSKQLWESTTASGFMDVTNRNVTLKNLANDNLIVGDGSGVAQSVDTSSVGDILADHTNGLTIKATSVTNAMLAGSIEDSKLASDYIQTSEVDGTTIEFSGGSLNIVAGGITNSHINASAAIDFSKLAALASGNILVGNGSNVATSVAMSGDVTIDNTGATTIGADKVKSSMIDWGTGADQVDAGEIPAAASATNYTPTAATVEGNLAGIDAALASAGGTKSMVAGEAFAANTSFVVRWAVSGETAGRVYKTDIASAASNNKFWGFGYALSTAAVAAGESINVTVEGGTHTIGSGDAAFSAGEIGLPVYLGGSGAWDVYSELTISSGDAVYSLGMVQDTDKIWVAGPQMHGTAE